uniref:Pyrin domain-containing protein n=1 Tax=Sander lucioperca TaxID=283035 RepID=A0A8D0CZ81_SANLU
MGLTRIFEMVILDALSELSEADLDRVKLLLSWAIVKEYGHIPRGCIETLRPCRLTQEIATRYSDHAAYVMSLIFTQIQRPDMVEELAAAARVPMHAEADAEEMRCSREVTSKLFCDVWPGYCKTYVSTRS